MKALRCLLVLLMITIAGCGSERPDTVATPTPPAPLGQTFESDLQLAKELSESYWRQVFSADGLAYRPITAFTPYRGSGGPDCGGEPSIPNNAFYCPAGHFIAYDADWMRRLYDEMGDGAVYVIIPHELGHAVQAQLNSGFRLNVEQELQADCYAGGTLSALVKGGSLQTEPGDEDELLLNLAAAGDPTDDWLRPDAHGTAEQRQTVFAQGYNQGTRAC
ncbi:neutral zinc metallopeptidase [Streptosporangium sp. NBC_01639]|uniref:neutral zinc metallopeptidase n=1 Tax=unclassified Streptosporangium TaxID=2632669 RepID=UPI002DDA8973|nr:neutral zinc metallopeptidase [Streptosporangium sp. NBC_01756]WSC83629.1 neutral zinc metallopeptidase [Streptosporangium sp. NBC_01756]WTD57764.1 neutral zinc metallopeptidase [Streptosporangium sp. NBC_01639]